MSPTITGGSGPPSLKGNPWQTLKFSVKSTTETKLQDCRTHTETRKATPCLVHQDSLITELVSVKKQAKIKGCTVYRIFFLNTRKGQGNKSCCTAVFPSISLYQEKWMNSDYSNTYIHLLLLPCSLLNPARIRNWMNPKCSHSSSKRYLNIFEEKSWCLTILEFWTI